MKYEGFTTFNVEQNEGVMTVTFDFPSVNVQEMLTGLNSLAMRLGTKYYRSQQDYG